MGHVLMDHRLRLPVDVEFTEPDGYAERAAAIRLIKRQPPRVARTLAADKAYNTREFVAECPQTRRLAPRGAEHRAPGWLGD